MRDGPDDSGPAEVGSEGADEVERVRRLDMVDLQPPAGVPPDADREGARGVAAVTEGVPKEREKKEDALAVGGSAGGVTTVGVAVITSEGTGTGDEL